MNSIRKSYAASISILLSFLLTFVGFPYSIPNAAHAAENHADISVELEVPSTSVGGESFEFLAKLSNQGPDAADGTTFTVEFEPGTTELTLECDQQTVGTSCPTGFQIETQGSGSRPLITGRVDALPASGKVAFKLKGKFPNSSSASTLLKAELPAGIIDDNPSSNEVLQQTALRTLAPAVTVSKVQDLDVVAVGQERTYTVTYENTGTIDADIRVGDVSFFYSDAANQNSLSLPYSQSYECDATASTMDCPGINGAVSSENNFVYFWASEQVTIPAGKKLVLRAKLTIDAGACGATAGDAYVVNKAFAMLPSGGVFANGEAELSESAVGRVRCVDVSTLTVMSDNSPQAGDTVQVSTRVSNSFGIAENVPFRMKLSTEQKAGKTVNVLEPAVTDIVCEVETGDAVCPTGFAYDAATNTITATIPRLSQGSAVWIRVDGLLITATKYLKSYDLFAEAPNVFGDVNLGDAGTNRSSTTFRWTEVVTIPIPTITLAVLDDCGLDNAVWVKPEDDDMLRWELSDGGRRIVAYTNDGYVFTDGQKLHDYGLAPDSGTPCAGTQPPAPNPPGSGSGVVPVQPEKPHATIVAKDKMGKLPATGTEVPVAMTVLLCGICLGSLGAYLRFRKAA